ncbi:unnamed protein product [Closterium sp. NIES-54]
MFITLYFIVTRLPDSLRSVSDHFLSLDPTSLTVDLLEEHLLAAETSAIAVGAARGTPRTPFFEGCSPSPLAPSYASAAAVDVPDAEDVGAAFASAKRRSSKGKGGRGGGGGSGSGGRGSCGGSGGGGGGGGGGTGGGGWGSGGSGGGSGGSGGNGGGWTGGDRTGARRGGSGVACGSSSSVGARPSRPSSFVSDCFSVGHPGVVIAVRMSFARVNVAEGDCYRCVPYDLGLAAAALGASESGTLPGTALAEALHTFTLDSGASRGFFRDSTTLTPLSAPVPVRLADPSGGLVVVRSSTVLPCPAVPSGSLSGSAGASPRLSPQQLCEWLVRRARLWSGATGAGGAGAAGAGGGGVSAGAGVPGGTSATGPGGARTRGTGAAGTGGVGGAGAGDPAESGAAGAGGSGAGGAGAGGAGAGGAGAVDPGGTVRP